MLAELVDIQDKDRYECLVGKYEIGHSQMTILARKLSSTTRSNYYVIFEDVRYFSGPFRWMGFEFSIGTREECKQILVRTKLYSADPSLLEKTSMKLFKVNLGEEVVKIIAGDVRIQRDDSR